MKYHKIIFLLLLFFFSNSALKAANTNTTFPDTTDWMPLEVGNKFQQIVEWVEVSFGGYYESGTYFPVATVTNDTIIENKKYYTLNNSSNDKPFLEELFYRYDTELNKLFVWLPEEGTARLAVDFNLPVDSHFVSYIRGEPINFFVLNISSQVIFGDTLSVYSINSAIANEEFKYHFANGIGLYKYEYHLYYFRYSYNSENNLIGAIIDSTIYNPIILEIDSLYPVIDRPIDTFPYLTNIPFSSNYYQLISQFYLSLEQQREDSIIFSKNYNVSISNPKVEININDLEVGDVIKLKATLKDNSIFNNVSTYPDTGWLSYVILPPVLHSENTISNLKYSLEQNYPNPFNPATTIKYSIPVRTFVELKIYDVLGKEIISLVEEEKDAGIYYVDFNAADFSSGIYFYQLKTSEFFSTKKMILIR